MYRKQILISVIAWKRQLLRKIFMHYKSSRSEVLLKVGFLKTFSKYTGEHLCQGLFSIKLQASIWIFFHNHWRITGLQGKGEGISLTPHYHFHPLHIHFYISRAIITESSALHLASYRTRTGNPLLPNASR